MNQLFLVWKKEVKDTIRDRRTLISMVVVPILLIPVLLIGVNEIFSYLSKQQEKETFKIAVENSSDAPELIQLIRKQENLQIVEVDKPLKEAIRGEEIIAGVVIPESFQSDIALQVPVELRILSMSTNEQSARATSMISLAVSEFNELLLQNRFSAQGLSPSILANIVEVSEDVATKEEQSGFGLGLIIPTFIILYAIMGGMYTAIDVSAGEKERKTLEALLLSPVRRSTLVIGKFLAVTTVSIFSIVLSLASIVFSLNYVSQTASGPGASSFLSSVKIDPAAFILITIVSILLVMMFSAILLTLGIFAKSFKEAQSYISPVLIVAMLPLLFASLTQGIKLSTVVFLIPGLNANFLFKELLIGTYDSAHILTTLLSLFVCAVVAIGYAIHIYSKEDVLFNS